MPKAKFSVAPDEPRHTSRRAEGQKRCLKRGECHCLHRRGQPDYWRLNLQPEGKGKRFEKYWHDPRELTPGTLRDQFSLKTLLSPRGTALSSLACMSLSVMLAHSLCYLLGQPWVEGRWNRHNIVFFGDGNIIPLRPFLQASHQPTTRNPGDQEAHHRYPEFLELGVMLLEIYFRRSLEAILGVEWQIETMDQCFASASQVYHSPTWAISQPGLRRAVHACLSLGVSIEELDEDGCEEADNEGLRKSLFDLVVRPLEEDLEHAYGAIIATKSLDEEAATKIWLSYTAAPNPAMSDPGTVETPRPTWLDTHNQRPSFSREPSPSLPVQPCPRASDGHPEPLTLFNIDTKAADQSPG